MRNPWLAIPSEDYENHMSDINVRQLQALNGILRSQILDHSPHALALFGVTTGNGLEYTENVDIVYAIDINAHYLDVCRSRFNSRRNIRFLKLDIDHDDLPFANIDMAIGNLLLEYIDVGRFISTVRTKLDAGGVLSVLLQNELPGGFVSKTKYSDSFECLQSIYHRVDENDVMKISLENGFDAVAIRRYDLPNGKQFCRIDLRKNSSPA